MERESEICAVFVCYSHKDAHLVDPIVALIRTLAASAFQDRDSITPGTKWRSVIFKAIDEANVIAVFWTKNVAESDEVQTEWTIGIRSNKRVVPVLLDSTPLPPELAEYQGLDLRSLCVKKEDTDEYGRRTEVLFDRLGIVKTAQAAAGVLGVIFCDESRVDGDRV